MVRLARRDSRRLPCQRAWHLLSRPYANPLQHRSRRHLTAGSHQTNAAAPDLIAQPPSTAMLLSRSLGTHAPAHRPNPASRCCSAAGADRPRVDRLAAAGCTCDEAQQRPISSPHISKHGRTVRRTPSCGARRSCQSRQWGQSRAGRSGRRRSSSSTVMHSGWTGRARHSTGSPWRSIQRSGRRAVSPPRLPEYAVGMGDSRWT